MIIEQNSTAPGTHPSWASHMMRVKCDMCGETWLADSCCDGVYSHSLAERAQYNAIMRGGRDMRDMAAEQAQYDAIRWSDRLQMTGTEMEEELQIARAELAYAREEGDPHCIHECLDNVAMIAAEIAVA